ncbi:MAG: sigma-70 family RNA polymerase sigma factor [Candidatus Eremiobacteraeota bacterium]|nr:sigma-70 family RNA polymerase sigma factor [Candidatus Eremiobacteraeota bacterium]
MTDNNNDFIVNKNIYINTKNGERVCITHFIDCAFICITDKIYRSLRPEDQECLEIERELFCLDKIPLSYGAWLALDGMEIKKRIIQLRNNDSPVLVLDIESLDELSSLTDRFRKKKLDYDDYILDEIERLRISVLNTILDISEQGIEAYISKSDLGEELSGEYIMIDSGQVSGVVSCMDYEIQKELEYEKIRKALKVKEHIKERRFDSIWDDLNTHPEIKDMDSPSYEYSDEEKVGYDDEKCAFDYFLDDLRNTPEITQIEETQTLAQMAQTGDIEARNLLVEGFLRLALKAANSLFFLEEIEDMVQEACFGLIDAVGKFDIGRDQNFHYYGYTWTWQRASRYVANNGFIRLPVHMMGTINHLNKVNLILWERLCREPSDCEIAKEMFPVNLEQIREELSGELGFELPIYHVLVHERISKRISENIEKIRELKYFIELQSLISIKSRVGEEEDLYLSDYLEDKKASSSYECFNADFLRELLEDVLHNLTCREKEVLYLRFGFEDDIDHTLEEIGREFGLTRERIRQIEAKALRKLRHPTRSKHLKDYWFDSAEEFNKVPSICFNLDRNLSTQIDRIFSRNDIEYRNFLWNSLEGLSIEKIYKAYYLNRNFDLENNFSCRKKILQYFRNRKPGTKRRKHYKQTLREIVEIILKENANPMTTEEIYSETLDYADYAESSISWSLAGDPDTFIRIGDKWTLIEKIMMEDSDREQEVHEEVSIIGKVLEIKRDEKARKEYANIQQNLKAIDSLFEWND